MAFACAQSWSHSDFRQSIHSTSSFTPKSCHHLSRAPRKRPILVASVIRTFESSDFVIQRFVGQQSYATITDWEYYIPSPLSPTRTTEPSRPAVRLYEARIASSVPELYNSRVLLKEFLEPGVELGVTEAEAYLSLYGADEKLDRDEIPVAKLLGSFLTDSSFDSPSFELKWRKRFPASVSPPASDVPFLVFKWEGLSTALSVATPRKRDDVASDLFDKFFPANLTKRKILYIRVFMVRALQAMLFLHSKASIVHRSIGLASLMVSTTEWRYSTNLQVKFRDLGFAKPVSSLVSGKELERARKAGAFTPSEIAAFYFADDLYSLGYAFIELTFSTLCDRPMTQDTFKVIFEDTFDLRKDEIQDYCSQDPEWTNAVSFLNECDNKGWDFILAMLKSRTAFKDYDIQKLLESPFLLG